MKIKCQLLTVVVSFLVSYGQSYGQETRPDTIAVKETEKEQVNYLYERILTVTNGNNTGDGSLRNIINEANAIPGNTSVEIRFAPDIHVKLTQPNSSMVVKRSMSILGNGYENTIIDGSKKTSILQVIAGSNANIKIEGICFQNAKDEPKESSLAGALYNLYSSLYVSDCRFQNNTYLTEYGSSAITNRGGKIQISNCTFLNNRGSIGGAILNTDVFSSKKGIANIINSTFIGNTSSSIGGALYSDSEVSIINSTFFKNRVIANSQTGNPKLNLGGAVAIDGKGLIINTLLTGNTRGLNTTKDNILVGSSQESSQSTQVLMISSIYETRNDVEGIKMSTSSKPHTPESIYPSANLEKQTLPISPTGPAALSGTIVGVIGDKYYYKLRNFWYNSNIHSGTFKPDAPDLGLTGAEIISYGQNTYTDNKTKVSRRDTHVGYCIGAHALPIPASTLVNSTQDEAINEKNPFEVTGTSLRKAIHYAGSGLRQADGSIVSDTVRFDEDIFRSFAHNKINLQREQGSLSITKAIHIIGNGHESTIITGEEDMSFFFINTQEKVSISKLSMTGSKGAAVGGFIKVENSPSLSLNNLLFSQAYCLRGGAIDAKNSNLALTNVAFISCAAEVFGGAIYLEGGNTILTNCTLFTNKKSMAGDQIFNTKGRLSLRNTVVGSAFASKLVVHDSGASTTVAHSYIQGQTKNNDNGNIDGNLSPGFISTQNLDLHLRKDSPLAGKGSTAYYEPGASPDISAIGTDLDGAPRTTGKAINIGAYESIGKIAIWLPEKNKGASNSERQNWHNPNNWSTNTVPNEFTTVYLPGTAHFFPVLSGNKADHNCEDIYFLYGAQLAQPQLLTYKRAHIQYNFPLQSVADSTSQEVANHLAFSKTHANGHLQRHQWHTLSAPLHDMVSGDFSFGSYPLSFLKKFKVAVPTGEQYPTIRLSDAYNTYTERLGKGEGFVLWMNRYEDRNMYREQGFDHDSRFGYWVDEPRVFGLTQVNGILEMPYYESQAMVTARRTQRTNGQKSIFHYMNEKLDPTQEAPITDKTEEFLRGEHDQAYRFIVEEYRDGRWSFPETTTIQVRNPEKSHEVLIGNPYMSTINFDTFYDDNRDKIEPFYRIWKGDGSNTLAVYGKGIAGTGNIDRYIAPLQSFFVTLKDPATTSLDFRVANVSVAPPAKPAQVRTAAREQEKNILRVAINSRSFSSEMVLTKAGKDQDVETASISKLFSPDPSVPEVFSFDEKKAYVIRLIEEAQTVVPIGIRNAKTEALTLRISGIEGYEAEKIELIDLAANKQIDLKGLGEEEYLYSFTPDEKVWMKDRFLIRIAAASSGIEQAFQNEEIHASKDGNNIRIWSGDNNLLKEIAVYDLQGRLLHHKQQIATSSYIVNTTGYPSGAYILKITSQQSVKNIKLNN